MLKKLGIVSLLFLGIYLSEDASDAWMKSRKDFYIDRLISRYRYSTPEIDRKNMVTAEFQREGIYDYINVKFVTENKVIEVNAEVFLLDVGESWKLVEDNVPKHNCEKK